MSVDPRARLHWIRNVRRGLLARTNIIRRLDRQEWTTVQDLAYDANLTATTVLYHLHHMHRENIVEKEPEGRKWSIGRREQASLADYLQPDSAAKKTSKRATERKSRSVKLSARRNPR